jgi:hypothetical protein
METPRRSGWLVLLVLVLLALVVPAGIAQASSPPVTFTGHFTQRFPGETEMITHSTGTITLSIHGQGSDGSRISFHDVSHYQINAVGVEVGFDKPSC